MDNRRQVGKSHIDVGQKNIAPIAVLPFTFNRFNSESEEYLVKCTHFLLIECREMVALTVPELHT